MRKFPETWCKTLLYLYQRERDRIKNQSEKQTKTNQTLQKGHASIHFFCQSSKFELIKFYWHAFRSNYLHIILILKCCKQKIRIFLKKYRTFLYYSKWFTSVWKVLRLHHDSSHGLHGSITSSIKTTLNVDGDHLQVLQTH